MQNNLISNAMLSEHRFWLQVLGDHARFIFYSLVTVEKDKIQEANGFINSYDNLLVIARRNLLEDEINNLTNEALELTYQFREFKLQLLSLTLYSKVQIYLSTTFFNHMVNELDEYILTLNTLQKGQLPLFNPIHYHLLWLSDAVGHAAGISSNLDEVELDLIEESKNYEKKFTDLFMKSTQLQGYMRSEIYNFPSLDRLNCQAVTIMVPFKEFLEELKIMRLNGSVLGTLMPLMADHMAREECYYLNKLSDVADNINKPDCSPDRNRIES